MVTREPSAIQACELDGGRRRHHRLHRTRVHPLLSMLYRLVYECCHIMATPFGIKKGGCGKPTGCILLLHSGTETSNGGQHVLILDLAGTGINGRVGRITQDRSSLMVKWSCAIHNTCLYPNLGLHGQDSTACTALLACSMFNCAYECVRKRAGPDSRF